MSEPIRTIADFSVAKMANKTLSLKRWKTEVSEMHYVFQPIVNILTASCVGYEALLRGHKGYESIDSVFDSAHDQGLLVEVTELLMDRTLELYSPSGCFSFAKLFVNLDSRVLLESKRFIASMKRLLDAHKVPASSIVIEISEKFDISESTLRKGVFGELKEDGKGMRIALDDYGMNYSGMRLFYYSDPNYLKIDRFFVDSVHSDIKKRIFLTSLINEAHTMGVLVIAEGIETEEEFYLCKELGCDMAQGYLLQRPDEITNVIGRRSANVEDLNLKDKRSYGSDNRLIFSLMETIPPVTISDSKQVQADVNIIMLAFREKKDLPFLPVVNDEGDPIGIILERKIKEYAYSPYGHSLLRHKGVDLRPLISPSPIFEISTSIEKILEGFSLNRDAEGIIITNAGKYAGFLSAKSLLRLLYDKNISTARDQNPLSKLPGNNMINDYLAEAIDVGEKSYIVAYFDFDNFKPYNDKYGFRKGDKAILMFADLLRILQTKGAFVGHIGGDDFFAAFRDDADCFQKSVEIIKDTAAAFASSALDLYTSEDKEKKCIQSVDREGNQKCFPLLSVSAAVLVVPRGERNFSIDDIGLILADAKKSAKHSESKTSVVTLSNTANMYEGAGTATKGDRAAGDSLNYGSN